MKFLRKTRAVIAFAVGLFSPDSECFGPCAGVCESVREWCEEHKYSFTYFAPGPGDENSQPALFTAVLPGSRAYGKHDIGVISPEDKVFSELSMVRAQWRPAAPRIEDHRLFRQLLLPRVRKLKGKAAMLAVPGGDTYYHWILETLPRLEIIRRCGVPLDSIDEFIVNGCRKPFQEATLRHLKLLSRAIGLDEFPHVKPDILIAPSHPGVSGDPPGWVLDFLRISFLDIATANKQTSERIYISRAQARHRRLLNEEEAVSVLAQFGFRSVCLEELPFADQVTLFRNAEAVVGMHGAGLANLVFCRPGTKVLEIFGPGIRPQMYKNISQRLNLDYHFMIAECAGPSEAQSKNRNAKADVRELDSALKEFFPVMQRGLAGSV